MQTLDIDRPGMPDLQFTLLVIALCTSRLTELNVPDTLRTRIFDRCWVLIHESPPPRRPEQRVLDLRPWTEVTLEAMVATIRGLFSDAGIRTLTWDFLRSEPARVSTPDARPVLEQVHQRSHQVSTVSGGVQQVEGPGLRDVISELTALVSALPPALKRRAADLVASGDQSGFAARLLKGADIMQESGSLYLLWARHYVAMSEGRLEDTDGVEHSDF